MSPAASVKTLKIDGRDLSANPDQTILDIARENDIFIPRLCELSGLSTVGACRLCLVEVKGTNKLLPSCVTRVEEGMEVTTTSPRLESYRKMILELLFTERNHICSVCVSNGHCELPVAGAEAGYHPRAFSLPVSGGRRGCLARPLRHRPQPLHSLHPLCPGVRRNRGRSYLGCAGPRH